MPFVDTTAPPPFTAVLLAGGKSTRMGRDKAGAILDGQPLWQRQLATLRAVHPHELFISGKADGPYAGSGVEILADRSPGLGPIAGLDAALRRASHPLVLVLAIDLSAMTPAFLASLLHAAAASATGCVPRRADWFEPLAAIYPRTCLPLVEACLGEADRSMQRFVRLAVAAGLVEGRALRPGELALFKNVNRPRDLDAGV